MHKKDFKLLLNKKPIQYFLCGLAMLSGSSVFASNFQNFTGINYTNPADLTVLVQDTELVLGDDLVVPNIRWNGTVTVPDPFLVSNVVVTGPARDTDDNFDLPYGRLAKRLSKQWVVGIDIIKPFQTVVKYSPHSTVRYATINSTLQSVDYAPFVAYQFTGKLEKLSVGAGLDIMEVWAALDKMYPSLFTIPFGAGPDSFVSNHASGWGRGWHVGAEYQAMEGTFLGLSYFSVLTPKVHGTSTFAGFPTTNNLSANINLPATTILSLTQFLSLDWFVRLQVRHTGWSRLKRVNLKNTAGPSPTAVVLFNYRNTWEADLSTLYNVNQKFHVGGVVSYDQTPTNNRNRTIGLPEVNQYNLGLIAGYKITKTTTLDFDYVHTFFVKKAPINTVDPNDGTTSVGRARIFADTIGARLTVDV